MRVSEKQESAASFGEIDVVHGVEGTLTKSVNRFFWLTWRGACPTLLV